MHNTFRIWKSFVSFSALPYLVFSQAYQQHVVSQLHIERAAKVFHLEKPSKKKLQEENKDREVFICDLCFCSCNGQVSWNSHLMGQKHRKVIFNFLVNTATRALCHFMDFQVICLYSLSRDPSDVHSVVRKLA